MILKFQVIPGEEKLEKKNYLSKEQVDSIVNESVNESREKERKRMKSKAGDLKQKQIDTGQWDTVATGDFFPFWNPVDIGDEIEGIVSNQRTITGKFGPQEVVDVGENSLTLSAGLQGIPNYMGRYIKVIFEGMAPGKKGEFKKFRVMVRRD